MSSNVTADGIPGHIQDKSTKNDNVTVRKIWDLSSCFNHVCQDPILPLFSSYFCFFNLLLFRNCPNVHIGIVELHSLFQNLGLKEESSKCLPLTLEKVQAHHRKMQSYSLQTIFLREGRKEGRSLCGDELSAFAGADFPTSLVFIRQPFAAGNHIGLFWTLISRRASLHVCVCVFRRHYVVFKLAGFPPELVYPPSSPLVCNWQCLTQLVTRPCLVLSC